MNFPEGVCDIIFNHMKQLEYEVYRKEHMIDCSYFRIKSKIGDLIDACKPPEYNPICPYEFEDFYYFLYITRSIKTIRSPLSYISSIFKHVDRGPIYDNLLNSLTNCFPIKNIFNEYESLYRKLNSLPEHKIPLNASWLKRCISFRILDAAKRTNRKIEDSYNIFNWRIALDCEVNLNKDEYINKVKFIKQLKKSKPDKYLKFRSNQYTDMKRIHILQKEEKKYKRNKNHKKKKYNYQKNSFRRYKFKSR